MVNSKLRRHKVMEKVIKKLMGNNLPPRFKFKDTYDSIEVPTTYQQYLPTQTQLEAEFDEMIAKEDEMPTLDASTDDVKVISSNLYLESNTGYVGIGTPDPSAMLDVMGDANVAALTATSLNVTGATNTTNLGLTHSLANRTTDTVFYSSDGNYIYKNTAAGLRTALDVPSASAAVFTGNVGVGTTQPRAALDIVGNVWINNGPIQSYLGIKAFGGNDVYDVADYKVHVFTTSGTLIVRSQISVDVLLVGGGGGGGWDNAGGGGAGGLIFKPGHTLQPGEYTVVIGKGGMGDYHENRYHTNGGNSTFDGLTALGGGHGGTGNVNSYGVAGGSGGGGQGESNRGGGAGIQTTSTGISADSRTYGYGNAGGTVTSNGGGGGGGAGGAGGASSTDVGGFGGGGLYQVTVGGTTYNFRNIFGDKYGEGVEGRRYFAGGGAGGNQNSNGTDIAGGRGGGGDSFGSDWYRYIMETGDKFYMSGQPNTGGGGAGVSYGGYVSQAGDGGTGIIIIRYQI